MEANGKCDGEIEVHMESSIDGHMKSLRILLILALAAFAFGKALLIPKEEARRVSVLFLGAPTIK